MYLRYDYNEGAMVWFIMNGIEYLVWVCLYRKVVSSVISFCICDIICSYFSIIFSAFNL